VQQQVKEKAMPTVSIPSRVTPVRIMRDASNAPAPEAIKTLCSRCHLRDLCLPCGMAQPDVERLDGLMFARRRVLAGQTLYREGDRFQFIYAVRSGTLKSSLMLADGREQVSGFHIAGELVGMDGVARGVHASATTALEDTEICAIPYAHLTDLGTGAAGVHHVISRLMSREILREGSLMMLLGSMNADERLAAFLLNLSQRFSARGYSEREFHLRMSRAEIGSYLGMKLETVSRTFSALQQERLLEVDKRHIRIVDLDALRHRFDARVQ
jgi:CRP/FNR family transcriptional regulator, anaerobic regulatory protein